MYTFNAIDVETANPNRASICQIGIVHVREGQIEDHWESLIDPSDWFSDIHIGIHGISEEMVEDAPTLDKAWEDIRSWLMGSYTVGHSNFDLNALQKACYKWNLRAPNAVWFDSQKVAQIAWPNLRGGYNLQNVTRYLGIDFQHHNALEDALAAAKIVLKACEETGWDVERFADLA